MSDSRKKSSASFGKRIEYVVIGELLRRGYDIYQTLVDDQGIDCVLRHEGNNTLVYLDIQIKARSKDSSEKHARIFSSLQIDESRPARPNYLFIFYSEHLENSYWVVPSSVIEEKASSHSAKKKGKYNLYLSKKYEDYRNEKGFDLLEKTLEKLDTEDQGMSFG